jgi:hypothetical protein
MAKAIKTHLTENGDIAIELSEFSEYVDTSKVVYYEVVPENDSLIVRFYDADENLIHTT